MTFKLWNTFSYNWMLHACVKHRFMTSRSQISHACLVTSKGICRALHLYSACCMPFSTFSSLAKKAACPLCSLVNSCSHLCWPFCCSVCWRAAQVCACLARAWKRCRYNSSAALQLVRQVGYPCWQRPSHRHFLILFQSVMNELPTSLLQNNNNNNNKSKRGKTKGWAFGECSGRFLAKLQTTLSKSTSMESLECPLNNQHSSAINWAKQQQVWHLICTLVWEASVHVVH